jgi:hypothetical protein
MRVLMVGTLLISTPVHAVPTYLKCAYVRDDSVAIPLKVTVDEGKGSVVDDLGGHPVRHAATFDGDEVAWSYEALPNYQVTYVLNRVSLRLTRRSMMFALPSAEAGSCEITKNAHPAPKRAF